MINNKPENQYDAELAQALLACAKTYLENREHLIYSFGSKTFLAGYDLYDQKYDERGNIDCSTFVLLVLSGIPYEKSPYAAGSVKGFLEESEKQTDAGVENSMFLRDPVLVDFSKLPEQYIPIAERIGHPELAGPKGLDLNKAEEIGLDLKSLVEKIHGSGVVRWSAKIAQYFMDRDACFTDTDSAMPGDLVFFRFPGHFTEGERKFKSNTEISHVGILTEDPSLMINSSGTYKKDRNAGADQPAISIEPVSGKRTPAFFARPNL